MVTASTVLNITAAQIFLNDFDNEPGLAITSVGSLGSLPGALVSGLGASVSVTADGAVTYTASATTGTESISYVVTDADGNTDSAELVVQVVP